MFECRITQQGVTHQLAITPALPEHTYALYVFARRAGETRFTRVKYQPYQKAASFVFVAEDDHVDLQFQYFVKDGSGSLVGNRKSEIIGKARKVSAAHKLTFSESLEADVVNDYVVPIKYTRFNDDLRHYVFFNGALMRNTTLYPVFNRHSWARRVRANTLNVYDAATNPTQGHLLGWYHGTREKPLYGDIAAIIERLKIDRGLSNEDLVFYGSSGGGWAALRYAAMFKGSLAVSVNPQIDILKYQFPRVVRTFLSHSYPGLSWEEVASRYSGDLAIDPSWYYPQTGEQASRFILVQNVVDGPHYDEHYMPFWQKFSSKAAGGWDDQKHNFSIVYDHPSGHGGEPDDVFLSIQQAISEMTGRRT